MPLTIDSRSDFTLENFAAAAWHGAAVRFSAAALARMAASRAAFLALLDGDPPPTIYGVTSGYGQRASRRLDREERQAHARRPPVATVAAFGQALPERVARGIVFCRLANFVEGHAAISPELAAGVAGLLEGGRLPPVPRDGQGGAGEILLLAPLLADLAESVTLGEKEALALINGSPGASALVADAALAAGRRLDLAERVFALSVEAFNAPLEAYDPVLAGLWGDPHEAAALAALGRWLEGAGGERRPYRVPVSYRILPRVLGQARRALAEAEAAAAVALAAVTDNPVFLPPDAAHPRGRVISNGGYHNASAAPAMDGLAGAAADLCLIADRHVSKLLDGRVSLLPDQLVEGDGAYLGNLGMAQVGYLEAARRAAQRTLLPGSEGGGFGQNDVAPAAMPAWRGQAEAGACLEQALANLAIVAAQALHVTRRPAPPPLAPLLDRIRAHVAPVTEARRLAGEAAALCAAFRSEIYPPED
ncbi:MAG: aromatic amino acid lyase [Dongiaceae bacterium]